MTTTYYIAKVEFSYCRQHTLEERTIEMRAAAATYSGTWMESRVISHWCCGIRTLENAYMFGTVDNAHAFIAALPKHYKTKGMFKYVNGLSFEL